MKYVITALAAATLIASGVSADPGGDKGKSERPAPAMKPGKASGGEARKVAGPVKWPDARYAMSNKNGPTDKAGIGPAKVKANGKDKSKDKSKDPAKGVRVLADGQRMYERSDTREWWDDSNRHNLIDGCPPGLAKKDNGCSPPGLAKKARGYQAYRPDWWGLGSQAFGSGNYLYDSGYLLRLDGDRVGGYIPLLGGALSIGNPWPKLYAPRQVPRYYVSYYDLGPTGAYRYADNVLYRVDPKSDAITSIAALLTGDDIRVGQPMPSGYGVYNVPYRLRSQYADGADASYRYSDGYVYQIDPKTRLVTAAIEMLTS